MNFSSMNARQQTDAFVTALLKHCAEVEVQSIRDICKPDESPSSIHRLRSLDDLERLRKWLWHENMSCNGQILIRPAAEEDHPWLFLDDVPLAKARAIANKYGAVVVWTSADNCHVRLLADRPLSKYERLAIQGELVTRLRRAESRADDGSTSGVKMGRLPGFLNRKPGKDNWTNLVTDTTDTAPRYAAVPPPPVETGEPGGRGIPDHRHATAVHGSGEADGEGGYVSEFSFACRRLRDGRPEHEVTEAIAQHALARGKRRTPAQARKYAETTVRKAGKALHRHR